MVPPTPNRLIRHRHSAFREQIFDVTQAEGKPEVEPYCLVNDLGRETIPAVADFLHPLGYSTTGRTPTTTRRDNAIARSGGGDMATGGPALPSGTIPTNAPSSAPTSPSCPLKIIACFVMSDFAVSTSTAPSGPAQETATARATRSSPSSCSRPA